MDRFYPVRGHDDVAGRHVKVLEKEEEEGEEDNNNGQQCWWSQ